MPALDAQLAQNTYLAGEQLSLADINLLAILDPVEITDIDMDDYPHLSTWRDKLRSQDYYLKVHQRFGEHFSMS